ncbi:MAG: hypothetical protein WD013_00355, partial [Gemmatimonadota bacterium]
GFLGRYEYQLDQKGRLSLPADYPRKAESGRFVLLQFEETHLTLFPEERWAVKQEEVLQLRKAKREMTSQIREVLSQATDVEPDKQGRILIPAWLKAQANLDGTVLVLGAVDRVELWNPETYESQRPEPASLGADDVEDLHRILG